MTQQYDRQCSLVVGAASGQGLDRSALRISFRVIKGSIQTPNVATIRIYNVAPATAQRVQAEATTVYLKAGYPGAIGTIFQGQVKQAIRGRESQVDTFLDIYAADSDPAYNQAVVSQTLAAGHSPMDVHDAIVAATKPYGVTAGQRPNLPATTAPRGRVLYGMARDLGRVLAHSYGLEWTIADGKVELVNNSAPPASTGQAISLSALSGMIGLPQQTEGGIMVRALINPLFAVGGVVHIDNASIQRAPYDLTYAGSAQPQQQVSVTDDGFYKILFLSHVGDTRDTGWYSDLTCVSLTGSPGVSGSLGSLNDQQGH